MTPAERASKIDEQEFRAESAAALQRALAYSASKRREERALVAGTEIPEAPIYKVLLKRGPQPKPISAFGLEMSISDWAKQCQLEIQTIRRRLKKGWSLELALTAPTGTTTKQALAEYSGRKPAFIQSTEPNPC